MLNIKEVFKKLGWVYKVEPGYIIYEKTFDLDVDMVETYVMTFDIATKSVTLEATLLKSCPIELTSDECKAMCSQIKNIEDGLDDGDFDE